MLVWIYTKTIKRAVVKQKKDVKFNVNVFCRMRSPHQFQRYKIYDIYMSF